MRNILFLSLEGLKGFLWAIFIVALFIFGIGLAFVVIWSPVYFYGDKGALLSLFIFVGILGAIVRIMKTVDGEF